MKKLKILILSDYAYIKGGAEKVAIVTATGLAEKGHEVIYFSAVGPVCKQLLNSPIKDIVCLNQKDILDNPNKLNAMISGIYNRKAVKRLKELFSTWIPDVVHIHSMSKALSWAPINTVHSYKIPIVYTLHNYGRICPNLGIYNYKTEKNCDLYKPGNMVKCLLTNCDKRNYLQKLWRWGRFCIINRNIFKVDKKISGFIAVSNFIEKVIKENLNLVKPIKVISNPIEKLERNNYVNEKATENINQLLYVGRLSREKGIDLLLEAIKEVDTKLVIIGDGELLQYCKTVSKKLGKNKVKILGYQNKDVITREMKKSLALVLPSRCMEPAPLVLGEAAINMLPSVVANHGGLAEFINDKVNGLYFKAGDVNSLENALNKIVNSPSYSKQLGRKAKDMMGKYNYDAITYLDNVERFYLDIINGKI